MRGEASSWAAFDHDFSALDHQFTGLSNFTFAAESTDVTPQAATGAAVGGTGVQNVDALIAGVRWSGALTYSFPDARGDYPLSYAEVDNGFGAVSFNQQQAARYILEGASSAAGGPKMTLTAFEQFTNASISDGGFNSADIRIAKSSSANPTAYAYYPSSSQYGGDVWFGTSYDYSNPRVGNYQYATMIHELGHALGLKHGHQLGGVSNVALTADRDSMEFSVMTYRSYVGHAGGGYTNETFGYAQTFMMYDIAALQQLYGADFTTNATDSVYSWSSTTGETYINGVSQGAPGGGTGGSSNRIFLTLWDGGGTDTYDFSNYTTNLQIDLSPGGWSKVSSVQLANLGAGNYARGNVFNALQYEGDVRSLIENAVGGAGNDVIVGNAIENKLTGGSANDTLSGGGGIDTAIYSGAWANYSQVHNSDGTWTISDLRRGSLDGMDTLTSIEFLQFSDGVFAVGAGPSNSIPTITSAVQAASLTEWTAGSSSAMANIPHTALGTITYVDMDAADIHTASFTPLGAGYLGTFTLNTGAIETAHAITWFFSVLDSEVDCLEAGQNVQQLYSVNVDDGQGGVATQTVTVTLRGASEINDLLITGSGTLRGGIGNDTLFGDSESDTLFGNEGNDVLDGRAGKDMLYGGIASDFMDGGEGNDSLFGDAGGDFMRGGGGGDYMDGGSGSDVLHGNNGDDLLNGGLGEDVLSGGAGADVFRFAVTDQKTDVVQDFTVGEDKISLTTGVSVDFVIASAITTAGGSTIINVGNNTLHIIDNVTGINFRWFDDDGLGGPAKVEDPSISGSTTLQGGTGNDTLIGGSGNDTIMGNDGNDILDGRSGKDTLYGGAGGDFMDGGEGNDSLFGDAGGDFMRGGAGGDYIDGAAGNDVLHGSNGNDLLNGGSGEDLLWGGAGADVFRFAVTDQKTDVVQDFTVGEDKISLTTGVSIESVIASAITTAGGSTIINVGNHTLHIIDNVTGIDFGWFE
jgi:serralysin